MLAPVIHSFGLAALAMSIGLRWLLMPRSRRRYSNRARGAGPGGLPLARRARPVCPYDPVVPM